MNDSNVFIRIDWTLTVGMISQMATNIDEERENDILDQTLFE